MKRTVLTIVLALLAGSCSGSGGFNCEEYASELRLMIERDAPAAEIETYLESTEEEVARVLIDRPEDAGPCVDAVLEATFMAGFSGLEDMLDGWQYGEL